MGAMGALKVILWLSLIFPVCVRLEGAEFEVMDKLSVNGGVRISTSATAVPVIFASSTTNQGNVGIGTTAPTAKLHVLDGDIRISTTSSSRGLIFQDGTAQASAGIALQFVSSETAARFPVQGTAIPNDDTIPQITEGYQVLAAAITPRNSGSRLLVQAVIHAREPINSCSDGAIALFKDSDADALCVGTVNVFSDQQASKPGVLHCSVAAGGAAARTYSVRIGCEAANAISVNDGYRAGAGGRPWGEAIKSSLTILELAP